MVITKPRVIFLLFLAVVFVVAEDHSLSPQQQVPKNELQAEDVEFSLSVTQAAVLRLLNESCTTSSWHERELQEMRDLRLELDLKARQLKMDFLNMNNELQNATAASLDEINRKKEELQNMTAASLDDIKTKKGEWQRMAAASFVEMNTKKEELENMTAASLDKIKRKTEEKQGVKEIVVKTLLEEDGWKQFQSSYYKLFTNSATYEAATANCRAKGGYLASIGSEEENNFLVGMIEAFTYIGLDDKEEEGVFTWQDGSPFNYSKWKEDEPNNQEFGEDCVHLYTFSTWNDVVCGTEYDYICERSFK